MATDNHAPRWRNFLVWSAVGALLYVVVTLGILSLRPGGLPEAMARPHAPLLKMVVVGLVSALLVGLAMRDWAVSARNMRNLLLSSAVAVAVALPGSWAVRALLGKGVLGASATLALTLGLVLLAFALLGFVLVAIAHARGSLLTADQAEAIRERGRAQIYSYVSMVAMGLTLIVLSLARPGGELAPGIALAGALVLLGVTVALSFRMWPLMDELSHTMSRDTGNTAFYLTMLIGGGWAMLAHLGFVPAPAPLDWVTLFTVILFAASFIAVGKRGLLKSR